MTLRRLSARAIARQSMALVLALALGLTPLPGRAADPPPEYYDGGLFDWYAHFFFWVNRQLYTVINGVADALPGEPAQTDQTGPDQTGIAQPQTVLGRGVANVASNLVNEPITAVTNLIILDLPTAWTAVQRFAVNSTVGILGWHDVASDWGLKPSVTDIGLVLCKAGVGEGAYIVVPFIGPRTLRDGVADIVLTNLILWSLTAAFLGTGASLQTILIAESIELVADLFATRQIDPQAKVSHYDDFAAVRQAYLEQRRERCRELRHQPAALEVRPSLVADQPGAIAPTLQRAP